MAQEAAAQDVWLIAFPEQVVGGYPAEDLVQWKAFVDAQQAELKRLAKETSRPPDHPGRGRHRRASAVSCSTPRPSCTAGSSSVSSRRRTAHLQRVLRGANPVAGGTGLALEVDGVPLGDYIFGFGERTIADGGVRGRLVAGGTDAAPVLRRGRTGRQRPLSPYRVGIVSTRREMLATRSADNQTLLMYVNAVGGQDGLVFDGGGYVFQNGRMLLDAPRFREDCHLHRRPGPDPPPADREHHVAIRSRGLSSSDRRRCRSLRSFGGYRPAPKGLKYPFAGGRHFFLPPSPRQTVPARRSARRSVQGAGPRPEGLLRENRRVRTLGIALSGGRDSLLALLVAWRAVQLNWPSTCGEEPKHRGEAALGLLHAEPLFGATIPGVAATLRRARRRASARSRSRKHSSARAGDQEMLGGEPPPN